MKEKNNHYQDLAYKFYFKTLRIKFHIYMGYDGEELKFTNTEINPLPNYEKRKDISYIIDGKTSYNIEFQSSAVYNDKMITIYKYHIYDETETGLPVKNIIFIPAIQIMASNISILIMELYLYRLFFHQRKRWKRNIK